MAADYLKPKDPNFSVHPKIWKDRRAYPHLKDCIGALDGTHVRASIPADDQVRYIGRSVGQPGSMHDTCVLYHAIEADKDTFPHPPKG